VQLEPLHEGAEKMLNVIDATKGKIGNISVESGDGIFYKGLYHFIYYGSMVEKSTQVKYQDKDIAGKFQALENLMQDENIL
jgi:hypothetical protein